MFQLMYDDPKTMLGPSLVAIAKLVLAGRCPN